MDEFHTKNEEDLNPTSFWPFGTEIVYLTYSGNLESSDQSFDQSWKNKGTGGLALRG
jgi:hypothetical protein